MSEAPRRSGHRGEGALIAFLDVGILFGIAPTFSWAAEGLGAPWVLALLALSLVPGGVLMLKSLLLGLGMLVGLAGPDASSSAWFGLVVGAALCGVAVVVWIPVGLILQSG